MNEPHKPTEKPTEARKKAARAPSKREQLQYWLVDHASEEIGESEYAELRETLAPISESYLRKLLRDSGASLAPMIAGVRQSTLDALESSLLALLDEYERGDQQRRAAVRNLIITAKDHARWAAHRTTPGATGKATEKPAPASNKQEMILWMVTWLENPTVFRQWIQLRRLHPDL
jgi:hypothetical protein